MSSSASIEAQMLTTATSPGWASACSSAKASPSSTAGVSGSIARHGPRATAQAILAGTIIVARPSTWPFPPASQPGLQPRHRWVEKGTGKTSQRGGKRKRHYRLTAKGRTAVRRAQITLTQMAHGLEPKLETS